MQKSAEEGVDTLQNQLRSSERAAGAYLRLHCVHKQVRESGRIRAECRAENATFPSIIHEGLNCEQPEELILRQLSMCMVLVGS